MNNVKTVRLALYVDNYLLTVGNIGHLKRNKSGKQTHYKRARINIPGGCLEEKDNHTDDYYENGIAREISEELGIVIPLYILKECNKIVCDSQIIFEYYCTTIQLFEWLSIPSSTPWEISGVVMYKISNKLIENNDYAFAEINQLLTTDITNKLIELNKDNICADCSRVDILDDYWYWKDNNIIAGLLSTKQFLIKNTKNYEEELKLDNMEINLELYLYIFRNKYIDRTDKNVYNDISNKDSSQK